MNDQNIKQLNCELEHIQSQLNQILSLLREVKNVSEANLEITKEVNNY